MRSGSIDRYRETIRANHTFVHPAGDELYAVWLPNATRPKLFELGGQAERWAVKNTKKPTRGDVFAPKVIFLDADIEVEEARVLETRHGTQK